MADKDVTFTVSGFTDNEKVILTGGNGESGQTVTVRTDSQGQALITIKSKIAGNGVLKATMKNGNFRDTTLRFAADVSTAQITALVLTNDKAVANGKDSNVAVVTVKDQFGNVVASLPLSGQLTNGAQLKSAVPNTNVQGQSTISFTNMTAGSSDLTVSITGNGAQKTVTSQFIADISTAKIAGVVVDKDNAIANGQERNTVTVTVVDGNGNVLANAPVTITVPDSGKYSTQPANGLTNSQGQLVINYTNTKAGTENYPVSINNSQEVAVLTFIGDVATARLVSVDLDGTLTEKIANGINTLKFTAKVEDAEGNTVKDVLVAWSKTAGPSLLPRLPGTMTNTDGITSVELTSSTTVDLNIQVSAQIGVSEKMNANKKVSFIADEGTATITDTNLTVVTNNQLANGVAKNQLKAVVTDAKGNRVPNVAVEFTAANGGLPAAQTVTTNASGEALFEVTNTTAGVTTVTASINGTDVRKDVIFEPGTPDLTKGSLTINKQRVIANKIDKATVTLTVVDANNNGVPNLTNITFVIENSQGDLVTSGITISDIKSGASIGTYQAEISGDSIGIYTVKAKLNEDYFSSLKTSFSLFNYIFNMSDAEKSILVNGTYQYYVRAIASDTSEAVDLQNEITWTSNNSSIATISNTGVAKGRSEGSVIVQATGIYNGFEVNVNGTLNIKEQKKSPLYGEKATGDKVQDYIIQPPSYSIAMRCGSIVDAMGTLEDLTGGQGGGSVIIKNLNNVKSIDITTGKWNADAPNTNVTKLVFNMKDGSASQTCGSGTNGVNSSTIKINTFTIPSDQTLQGYQVSGGRYIHAVQFITMPLL